MKSMKSNLSMKMLALGASMVLTGVSTAVHADVLDDAIMDYAGIDSSSVTSSSYRTDEYQTTLFLEQDYYDWSPQSLEGLEEAEFAAFEVPDDLRVND